MRSVGFALVLMCSVGAAQAATVTFTIEGVLSNRGEVHVDLCDEATFLGPNCPFDAYVPAQQGRVTIVLRNIPPGHYAAIAYHDTNANHDLDLNALGIPMEHYGFSNDPPMLLGPPLFKDSAIDVGDTDLTVTIRLNH
jgi:uncharacterized protein (DUF2141 family)